MSGEQWKRAEMLTTPHCKDPGLYLSSFFCPSVTSACLCLLSAQGVDRKISNFRFSMSSSFTLALKKAYNANTQCQNHENAKVEFWKMLKYPLIFSKYKKKIHRLIHVFEPSAKLVASFQQLVSHASVKVRQR